MVVAETFCPGCGALGEHDEEVRSGDGSQQPRRPGTITYLAPADDDLEGDEGVDVG